MKQVRISAAAAVGVVAILAPVAGALAQPPPLATPRPSPNASVSQNVGVTTVTIHYSRPGVKGRVIWGKLVPYGQVWRAGANENTTFTFSTPVKIDGKELPAGTYSFQAIPTADDWTLIFSKDADMWGAFNYKPERDALRLQAKPVAAAPQEWMSYEFANLSDTGVEVALRWEKLRVPFRIEVDTPRELAAAANSMLRWQTPFAAANYCIQSNQCQEDALRWLDASIALDANFTNQRAKATLLAKRSDFKGAVTAGEKALAAAVGARQAPPAEQVTELRNQVAEWKMR